MKIRKVWIIGGVSLVAGAALAFTGFTMGAATGITWRDGHATASKRLTSEKTLADNTKTIEIKGKNLTVEVFEGEDFSVKSQMINIKPKISIKGDKVQIEAMAENRNDAFVSVGDVGGPQRLMITVPKNLEHLVNEAEDSKVNITDINLKNLEMNTKNGYISLTDSKVTNQASINISADKDYYPFVGLWVSNSEFNLLDFKSENGSVTLDRKTKINKQADFNIEKGYIRIENINAHPNLKISGKENQLSLDFKDYTLDKLQERLLKEKTSDKNSKGKINLNVDESAVELYTDKKSPSY